MITKTDDNGNLYHQAETHSEAVFYLQHRQNLDQLNEIIKQLTIQPIEQFLGRMLDNYKIRGG